MPGRYGYDLSDDLKMLKSLYDRLIQNDPDALKPCGLKIWRSIIHEDGRFKRHSAQALATRMRRFVLPNLQKLCQRLTGEIEAKLIKSYKFYIDENRKSQKFNVIDEQEEDENDTDESCKLTDDESNEPYIINNRK
uniref:Uncharacterized protein n=1 Tax=Romanomermis culicivorax TaxID=13658 RepID=A0A915KR32_ROMCU